MNYYISQLNKALSIDPGFSNWVYFINYCFLRTGNIATGYNIIELTIAEVNGKLNHYFKKGTFYEANFFCIETDILNPNLKRR